MTLQIILEDPPEGVPPELAAWLQRQIYQIQDAFEQRLDLDTEITLDEKPQDGMFRYIVDGPEGAGFYGRINGVWVKFGISGDVLIGYYDVATQLVDGGVFDGQALPAATSVNDREYMIVQGNGTLVTPNAPEINGVAVGTGDIIRAFNGLWYVEAISGEYLSSVVDDTANGYITLVKTPIANGHAAQYGQVQAAETAAKAYADAGDATRLPLAGGGMSGVIDMNQNKITDLPVPTGNNEAARLRDVTDGDTAVQGNLDTHIGNTTSANDVHGSKTYTDSQDAAHAALVANPDDPHQTKTYTDQEITALATAVLANFVSTAYGGLTQNSDPGPSAPDLGSGWVTVPFSEGAVSTPRDIIQNPSTNSIIITEEGIYSISIGFSITHNESNGGRETFIRLWNITKGSAVGTGISIGIARNQPSTTFSWVFMAEILPTNVNDEFRVEMGNGDNVSISEWVAVDWNVFHISEFKGVLN